MKNPAKRVDLTLSDEIAVALASAAKLDFKTPTQIVRESLVEKLRSRGVLQPEERPAA